MPDLRDQRRRHHSVDVADELAKVGTDSYRPLRVPALDAITGDS